VQTASIEQADPRRPDPTDENARGAGLGVKLVETLASDWGVERDDETTEVWFKIS
jgi:hypothetical protein